MKKLAKYLGFFLIGFVFIHILTSVYFFYNTAKSGQGPCMLEYIKSGEKFGYLMTKNNYKTLHIDKKPQWGYKTFGRVVDCFFFEDSEKDINLKNSYLFLSNSIYCSTSKILLNL